MPSLLSRREETRALRLARSQPESAGEFQELIDEITERAVELVFSDLRVKARFEGTRYEVLTADYREDKPTREQDEVLRWGELGVYDYDHDTLVVAVVDLREGAVVDLVERKGVQPPITAREIEAAKALASRDRRLAPLVLRSDAEIVAFPTPSFLESYARAGHRCATLYVSPHHGHQEVSEVTVDLSAREIVPQEELLQASPRIAQSTEQSL